MTHNPSNTPVEEGEAVAAGAWPGGGRWRRVLSLAAAPLGEGSGLTVRETALVGLGFAPLLVLFFLNLWNRPQYQFFPLALAMAGLLAWTRLREVTRPFSPGHPVLIGLLMGASFLTLAAGTVWWSPWLGSVAALLGAVGMTWWLGGGPLLRALVPAFLLVVTLIPPPLNLDTEFVLHLRGVAVRWSSRMLDALGVLHLLSGNTIELPRQKLLVEEACSGINSVLFTVACGLFYGLWRRRSPLRILLLLGAALAAVLLGNVARITLGAWLRYRFDVDILSGWPHEVLGLMLVATYLVMIVSMDRWIIFLVANTQVRRSSLRATEDAAAAVTRPAVRRAPVRIAPFWGRVAACAFVVVGLAQLGQALGRTHQEKGPVLVDSALRQGAKFTLPEQIGAWQRVGTEDATLHKIETMGVLCQVWRYQKGGTVAEVALDYPFRGYHDLRVCYRLRGWTVAQQNRVPGGGTNGIPPLLEVQLEKELINQGALWFSTVDEQGRWLEPEVLKEQKVFQQRFLNRWKFSRANPAATYQMQTLVTSYAPLPPEERAAARQLFEEARTLLTRQLFNQMRRKA